LRVGSHGDDRCGRSAAKWEGIDITFTSEERVQVRIGQELATYNYSELGFEDSRSGKPNRAWALLMDLAESRGALNRKDSTEKNWPQVEKRIQEVRKILRERFGLNDNPLSYVRDVGYCARFKIRRGESFNS